MDYLKGDDQPLNLSISLGRPLTAEDFCNLPPPPEKEFKGMVNLKLPDHSSVPPTGTNSFKHTRRTSSGGKPYENIRPVRTQQQRRLITNMTSGRAKLMQNFSSKLKLNKANFESSKRNLHDTRSSERITAPSVYTDRPTEQVLKKGKHRASDSVGDLRAQSSLMPSTTKL